MGYSYDMQNRLCCDTCNAVGGVRKIKCPFGYCPALAMCPTCRKDKANLMSEAHHKENGCEVGHARSIIREYEWKKMLEAGRYLRSSALAHGDYMVKVYFTHKDKPVCWWMNRQTYDAIPLLRIATIEDYKEYGKVIEAKTTDLYDAESMAVAS